MLVAYSSSPMLASSGQNTNFPKPDASPGVCNAGLVLTACALAPFDITKAVWCAFHSATVGHALFCMRTGAFVPATFVLLCQPSWGMLRLWGMLRFRLDL